MSNNVQQPKRPQSPRDAVERLYIYFAAGALLAAIALLILAFFTTGRFSQQFRAITELSDRLTAMERTVAQLSRTPPAGGNEPVNQSVRGGERGAPPPAGENVRTTPRPTSQASAPVTARADQPSDAAIRSTYDLCVGTAEDGLPELRDEQRATELVQQAWAAASQAGWRGDTWLSLAIAARLIGDDEHAARFLARAEAAGADASVYHELSARRLLEAGRPAEAALFARALLARSAKAPQAALLLAAAQLAQRNPAEARRTLVAARDLALLNRGDRLRLAELYAALERWGDLERVLNELGDVPEAMTYERDYLRAVSLVAGGKYAEAVAILDFLISERPQHYEAHVWRGVALMRAKQPEAAGQTLTGATEISPGRPEAWYWLAVMEMNEGRAESAGRFLQNALAASTRFAPAWEARAALALHVGDLKTALESVERAMEADSGRATAHFLLAVCQAKASRRDDTAGALRRAFALDPTLIEQASKAEVIARLFDRRELEALLPEPPGAATQPSSGPQP